MTVRTLLHEEVQSPVSVRWLEPSACTVTVIKPGPVGRTTALNRIGRFWVRFERGAPHLTTTSSSSGSFQAGWKYGSVISSLAGWNSTRRRRPALSASTGQPMIELTSRKPSSSSTIAGA
jgi:hypothetical protein